MTTFIAEIITLSSCCLLYILAWQKQRQGKYQMALALLIFAGLILRVFAATDWYLHEWDERFHALVSKNMMTDPFRPMLYVDPLIPFRYYDWSHNHIWVHKQPFPLWMMSLSMTIGGVNELALRMPSILLSTIGIWATFFIAKNLFNQRVAFIAAFLFSIHGLIIEITAGRVATDHIDVFFMVLIELAFCAVIVFAKKKQLFFVVLAGILTGLAVLSKWLPAFILFPMAGLYWWQSRNFSLSEILKYGCLLVVVCFAVFLPWQCYVYATFPKEFAAVQLHNWRHITEVLNGRGGPFYYHFDKMRIIYGELIYLPLLWFLFINLKKRNNLTFATINLWLWVPFIFFSFVQTKMQAYTLLSAPALLIITAYFWHWLKLNYKAFRVPVWTSKILLLLLLALPIRYSIERLKVFQNRPTTTEWTVILKSLPQQIKERDKVVVFNCHHAIEGMFYTPFTCYKRVVKPELKKELLEKGYTIYTLRKGKAFRVK